MDRWLPGYLAALARRPPAVEGPRHLIFCVADHFEPLGGGVPLAAARASVRDWSRAYAERFSGLCDADGRPPVHTFFYPADEYDPACLEALAPLVTGGMGEVEVHLHHRHDTEAGFEQKLLGFRDVLHGEHGYLGPDASGAVRYGFVHGNWALCNSRPDGDWCGVNGELGILRRTGCYADFTFPSAPSPTQPRLVNALYYARDAAGGRPRGHDRGVQVRAGAPPAGPDDALLMIQGPLALNWHWRKWGLLPRLENAELSGANPPSPGRIDLWAAQQIHVPGRSDWVFVKVHTHGMNRANRGALLGDAMSAAHRHLQTVFNDGQAWRLHYVSAREMANLVHAAEAGRSGEPGAWRDAIVAAPPRRGGAN